VCVDREGLGTPSCRGREPLEAHKVITVLRALGIPLEALLVSPSKGGRRLWGDIPEAGGGNRTGRGTSGCVCRLLLSTAVDVYPWWGYLLAIAGGGGLLGQSQLMAK